MVEDSSVKGGVATELNTYNTCNTVLPIRIQGIFKKPHMRVLLAYQIVEMRLSHHVVMILNGLHFISHISIYHM